MCNSFVHLYVKIVPVTPLRQTLGPAGLARCSHVFAVPAQPQKAQSQSILLVDFALFFFACIRCCTGIAKVLLRLCFQCYGYVFHPQGFVFTLFEHKVKMSDNDLLHSKPKGVVCTKYTNTSQIMPNTSNKHICYVGGR